MSNYLYLMDEEITLENMGSAVLSQVLEDGRFVYLSTEVIKDGVLAGKWKKDGSIEQFNVDIYQQINPSANAKDGSATGSLAYHNWQGEEPQREQQITPIGDTTKYFPANRQPMVLDFVRTESEEGHGWEVTIVFVDQNRSPVGYKIEILKEDGSRDYRTPFNMSDGNWKAETPNNRETDYLAKIDYVMLSQGNVRQGSATLPVDQDRQQLFFWEA